jgi:hypothetical protein
MHIKAWYKLKFNGSTSLDMKFFKSITAIGSLLCLSTFCFALQRDNILSLTETYSEPKNIAFSAVFGGSSHYNWVLVILNELHNRGHNVSFIAKVNLFFFLYSFFFKKKRKQTLKPFSPFSLLQDDGIRCSKSFPWINTKSLGPEVDFDDKNLVFTALEERTSDIAMKLEIATALKDTWRKGIVVLILLLFFLFFFF